MVLEFLQSLPSPIAQGMIWGIMAIGVFITFRVLDLADLTVDGTLGTGGAVLVILTTSGLNVWLSLLVAFIAGCLAGLVTGVLHTKFGIPAILAGILTQLALYSINLRVMGGRANTPISHRTYDLIVSSNTDLLPKTILVTAVFIAAIIAILYWFFGTEMGHSIRATGANEAMARANGINTNSRKIIGLVLSSAATRTSIWGAVPLLSVWRRLSSAMYCWARYSKISLCACCPAWLAVSSIISLSPSCFALGWIPTI